jgi:hypothetical protein
MTNEELTARVQDLQERLARLASAFVVLLESIDDGTEITAAREIREVLNDDLQGSDE